MSILGNIIGDVAGSNISTSSGTSSSVGGTFGSAKEAAEWNLERQKEIMAYNSAEAQKNRDWQKMMSDTSYQRAMEDMQKAGLNPILAYQQGGATTPGGASASATAAHRDPDTHTSSHGSNSSESMSALLKMAENIAGAIGAMPSLNVSLVGAFDSVAETVAQKVRNPQTSAAKAKSPAYSPDRGYSPAKSHLPGFGGWKPASAPNRRGGALGAVGTAAGRYAAGIGGAGALGYGISGLKGKGMGSTNKYGYALRAY